MNVGFAGTPAFAATVLAALLDAGFGVPLVLTQPDRPSGRGLRREPSPVKRLALERGVPLQQPASLAGDSARDMLRLSGIDVLAVAAYGLLLPPPILDTAAARLHQRSRVALAALARCRAGAARHPRRR